MGKCQIVCAGGFDGFLLPPEKEDFILAADGGFAHLQKLGITPDGILGDFDSLGYIPENAQVFPVEKDDTDAMLAVKKGLELGYQEFFLYGCLEGPRLDHTIATYQTLQYVASHGGTGYAVGKDYIVTVLQNGTAAFAPSCTGILSVFCMGKPAEGVTLQGLQYPLQNSTLTVEHPLGVSNHFIGQGATVSVKKGSLLLLWDRANGLPRRW